jgi:dolichyl-phosphate-mannose-protein mannosyltransferase
MKNSHRVMVAIGALAIPGLLIVHLESVPPVWWDEGWTLTVARNWVEHGHYGRYLAGEPVRRGLEAAFPMTAMVALSFRLIGIGIFSARIVAIAITMVTLVLLYQMTRLFYGRACGLAAVAVVMCLQSQVEINPLIAGRQLMGEMPALLFLLAGYLCVAFATKRAWLYVPSAVGFWALALFTKVQVKPFLMVALFVPIVLAVIRRQFKLAKIFGASLVGSLTCHLVLEALAQKISPSTHVSGLTPAMALVLAPHIRFFVLFQTIKYATPTVLGLLWGLRSFFKQKFDLKTQLDMVRFSFFILVASWFGWYETLSVGWLRYMFPAAFLASIFVAAMLFEWTNGFNFRSTIGRVFSGRGIGSNRKRLTALASIALLSIYIGQTIKVLYAAHTAYADESIKDVVQFLNTETSPNVLIETYETELFFLLNRRYHYPPDQMHVELLRQTLFKDKVKINYDPLAANPDYLVVGFHDNWWKFYDRYIKDGDFKLIRAYSRYKIYERRRR